VRVARFPKMHTVVGIIGIFPIYMRKAYMFYVFPALLARVKTRH